ncbi:Na+/H+ antiporter subunit A [uncultured Microbacterium sp.]|uniref:Na+/H+ antiporter subunit A n=1 Tax=uncultured Microbacterium sp. TaxID=191216 RepID=UPI0025D600EA|nr:Na+/H+ antiporter subunit A [uncultured Microbacterium sp.]
MLALLAAFGVVPLLLPWLIHRIGPRAFSVAAVLPAIAFGYTLWLSPRVLAGEVMTQSFAWIPSLGVSLSMRMDTLSWLMALVVTGVGALVLLYCRWYFAGKMGLGQFSAVLLAFAGAMYGLVLTDDLIMLVMFWELTSILSYLLIGHYSNRAASRRAALQALMVTTLGGLVMFVGAVFLVATAGTTSISAILADPPTGPVVTASLVLLLVGALSKSAIFPFHFWLPGAMAAPTPVSAYLHAAAMVKAGIYLIARLAPTFAIDPAWRPIVISLGAFTMLLGGFQSLRENDLKRILAFGTVSQLGLLTVVLGFGTRDVALGGIALLLSHALFKSCLFLIVGIIDRQLGTRDIDELSGVGRQAPTLATVSFIAIGSMIGVIPTLGFVAKESVLAALLYEREHGSPWGIVALVGVVAGSALTAAYGIRFLWGAFFTKKDADGIALPATKWPGPPIGFLATPVALAVLTLAGGFSASLLNGALAGYADTAPAATPGIPAPDHPGYLALWHGLEPALFVSLGSIALGFAVFYLVRRSPWIRTRILHFTAVDVYNGVVRTVDRLSVATTTLVQRGSLPIYVGTIFVVFVASQATALLASSEWRYELEAWQTPEQVLVAPLMILAGFFAVRARKRYTGVVLVSVTGLGMIVLFATSGAPDLALTQILIETVTLVTFALVLRRLPARMGDHNDSVAVIPRALLAVGVGVTMAAVAIVAVGARIHEPISTEWATLAYEIGHGRNVVNVALVDMRGWDTMGELSVLVLAATGVASLVFVTNRSDNLQRFANAFPSPPKRLRARRRPLVETNEGPRPVSTETRDSPRAWLVGGQKVKPENRSILLEIIVRILFHTIIVISIYLLFAGHNLPGGGFAGGLVAGMALVMRYIAGGRYELGVAAPTDAGRLLGAGLIFAVGAAVVPLFFGQAALQSTTWEGEIPLIGHWEFVSSTFFDIGVYLVVVGLVLDVLRALGAEVDRQLQELREGQSEADVLPTAGEGRS